MKGAIRVLDEVLGQHRFSQVNEDVATNALAFILGSSEFARRV